MSTNEYSDAVILNVDDNDGARYVKSRVLMRAGFKVVEASCGEEALCKSVTENPNLILLDVKLPDINGLEVCRKLKQNSQTQTILVLQTSASFIGSADKIRALESGADNYLVEPIEPEELIANVKALLRLGMVERQLREMGRRKDEFLATLAHELRNPLGPIKTSVELLRRLDPTMPPLQEKARDTIQRHTNHLARLVDDLLDVSRISNGKISLKFEAVEIKSAINSSLESSLPFIESKGHSLTLDLPEEDVWVRGDSVRLSQVVTNLLLNAGKFTPPGGEIKLAVEVTADAIIIRVTDNGIGISADNLEHIFDLFTQGEKLEASAQDGLGIGLSLVRTLVQLHGGSVVACSPGNRLGSTFEITLPRNLTVPVPQELPASPAVDSRPKRVLIVDDNVDGADTLAQLLSLVGHQVETAYSGAMALASARRFHPEVIFLDIDLPDMNGFEVGAKLRASPELPPFQLVALTGFGQEQDIKAGVVAGFDQHFVKPLDFAKLNCLGLTIEEAVSK
jgi:signal transduction histidine kinase